MGGVYITDENAPLRVFSDWELYSKPDKSYRGAPVVNSVEGRNLDATKYRGHTLNHETPWYPNNLDFNLVSRF